ncbi:MAG: hypothetical protein V1664_02160 [Candidatus Uhrbacteria bacterium]
MPNNNSFLQPEEKEFQSFYKRSLWLIKNRPKFRKIGLLFFIIFDVVLVFYAAWIFLDSFVLSRNLEEQSVASLALNGQTELRNFSTDQAAKSLLIGQAVATPAGDGKSFDLTAMISNPNTNWYATFDYSFLLKDGNTASQSGFLLPGEERPMILLQATTSKSTTLDLVLDNLAWHRVDQHEIPDYSTWSTEHLDLPISGVVFFQENTTSALLSFTIKNNSAYNFWQPNFSVVLWRGPTIGGVMRLSTADLQSGEEQKISARWLGAVPAVTKVEVYPEINIFSPEAYSSLEGQNPDDIRTRVQTDR